MASQHDPLLGSPQSKHGVLSSTRRERDNVSRMSLESMLQDEQFESGVSFPMLARHSSWVDDHFVRNIGRRSESMHTYEVMAALEHENLMQRPHSVRSLPSDSLPYSRQSSRVCKRQLTVLSVVAMVFFNVSGGPWGSEPMFKDGPFWGILAIIAITLCWGLPQVLITAELSSAFPLNGGYSIWVADAFGPFWGMMETYLSWISGVVDNAIYPVLIFDSIVSVIGPFAIWYHEILVKIVISLILTAPNLLSLNISCYLLQFLSIASMIPFLLFLVIAVPTVEPSNLLDGVPFSEIKLSSLLMVCFWNLSGWDCVSTIAGEVQNPGTSMIRALLISLFLAASQYIVILGTAAGQPGHMPFDQWNDGSLTAVVTLSCGTFVGSTLVIASALGNAGMYVAELTEDSFQVEGMAVNGLLPMFLGWKHPRFHTPWAAIGLSLAFIFPAVCGFSFLQLVGFVNCFQTLGALLEFMAYLQLRRRTNPKVHRPYEAPRWILLPLLVTACGLGIMVIAHALFKSTHAFVLKSSVVALGFPLSYVMTKYLQDEISLTKKSFYS